MDLSLLAANAVLFCALPSPPSASAVPPDDLAREAAVLMDAAKHLHSLLAQPLLPPPDRAAASSSLAWCFRAARRLVALAEPAASPGPSAAPPPPPPPAPHGAADAPTAGSIVLRVLSCQLLSSPGVLSPRAVAAPSGISAAQQDEGGAGAWALGFDALDAALELLCTCPGGSAQAAAFLRQLEQALFGRGPAAAPAAPAPSGGGEGAEGVPAQGALASASARDGGAFLALLGHTCHALEAEGRAFRRSAEAAHALGARDGAPPGAAAHGQEVTADQAAAGGAALDYMAQEEAQGSIAALTQARARRPRLLRTVGPLSSARRRVRERRFARSFFAAGVRGPAGRALAGGHAAGAAGGPAGAASRRGAARLLAGAFVCAGGPLVKRSRSRS